MVSLTPDWATPWRQIIRIRAAMSAELVKRAPPSPRHSRFRDGAKDVKPTSATEPAISRLPLTDGGAALLVLPRHGTELDRVLRGVLDDEKIMLARYVENGRHVRHTAKEVDGDYGSSSRRDFAFDVLRVNV